MSSNISIPKFCTHCNQAFIAKTTTTRFCSHKCASRAYKKRKTNEKVQATLTEQINFISSENTESLQSHQNPNSNSTQFLTIKHKEFLSIQEASLLLGTSRWTIQRMIQREEIKTGKVGRRVIIPRTEINKLFN